MSMGSNCEVLEPKALKDEIIKEYENILKNMEIRLPVDSNDNIDYTYITAFIKAQEKLSIKSVIDWKDKIINTSKKCI